MSQLPDIIPLSSESPTSFADRLGARYATLASVAHKKQAGQYFTPTRIAEFMGSLLIPAGDSISILDPGCGTAILSCALVEQLFTQKPDLKRIRLTVYETDERVLPYTGKALDYLQQWLRERAVCLDITIRFDDFILANRSVFEHRQTLDLFSNQPSFSYDYVIANPPYFKLPKDDLRVKVCEPVVSGQPNIYALFTAVAIGLLRPGGQYVFIIPRSFASGQYFRAFRQYLFRQTAVRHIHLFASRKDAFKRDSILQEMLILNGSRSDRPAPAVKVSTSHGLEDLATPVSKTYALADIVAPDSSDKLLHLPTSELDEEVIRLFRSWHNTLSDYGLRISTGPVVAFRAVSLIREMNINGTVTLAPLYWLHNVTKMSVNWPVAKPGKGQYIEQGPASQSLLLPNQNYVFLRRFSAKDDKSRLVAAPYLIETYESDWIGVENKVNYICRPNGSLPPNEAVGLAALLNSTLFDTYFRTFNGNVNVSATELRQMPFPPLATIRAIGDELLTLSRYSPDDLDDVVSRHLTIHELSLA